MFENGPDVSFSNCSLPFYLSGIVEKQEDLVLMNPKIFKDIYNIDARVNSEVLSIDRNKKIVSVNNLIDNVTYEESYDVLILSPGAKPIMPHALKQYGYDNITNITGSFMGICECEYFKDQTEDRKPIVTNYYFK